MTAGRQVGDRVFIPLISKAAYALADLRILMLRPGPPGEILRHGGDIDNRLKTLFDALTVPQENQLRPRGEGEPDWLYCLLEDDGLVSSVEVRAEQLLEEVEPGVVT